MERNSGIRRALTIPRVYELSQSLLYRRGAHAARAADLFPGLGTTIQRVLDIGSGPAAFLAGYGRTVDFEYVAIDPSPEYIAKAEQRFPGRGRYLVGTTTTIDGRSLGSFDLVIADGVLHHVSDEEAVGIARFARDRLAPGGRFITLDPVRIRRQHPVTRLLLAMDRGARIRSADEYRDLLRVVFGQHREDAVVHGRLRLPYDHFESSSWVA